MSNKLCKCPVICPDASIFIDYFDMLCGYVDAMYLRLAARHIQVLYIMSGQWQAYVCIHECDVSLVCLNVSIQPPILRVLYIHDTFMTLIATIITTPSVDHNRVHNSIYTSNIFMIHKRV